LSEEGAPFDQNMQAVLKGVGLWPYTLDAPGSDIREGKEHIVTVRIVDAPASQTVGARHKYILQFATSKPDVMNVIAFPVDRIVPKTRP